MIFFAYQVFKETVIFGVKFIASIKKTVNECPCFIIDRTNVTFNVLQYVVYLILAWIETMLQKYTGYM